MQRGWHLRQALQKLTTLRETHRMARLVAYLYEVVCEVGVTGPGVITTELNTETTLQTSLDLPATFDCLR